MRYQAAKRAPVLLAIALYFTCATQSGCSQVSPAQHASTLAFDGGATQTQVDGVNFEHVVFTRGVDSRSTHIHIYFGSDGSPFERSRRISPDPTAREPLALQLMLVDPEPSIYVGRPCYEGLATAPNCDPILWTLQRYSDAIVTSMAAAVERLLAQSPNAAATLIGYSGGGVLAVLVANRVPQIDTVVTIAADLDIDAWTSLHGYSQLVGSINPATQTQWRTTLRQIHFAGALDDNVPPALVQQFAATVPTAQVHVIERFDHRCCWLAQWPALLSSLPDQR
jgi:pimeloyl-ACP methyl ester carboxylesterase